MRERSDIMASAEKRLARKKIADYFGKSDTEITQLKEPSPRLYSDVNALLQNSTNPAFKLETIISSDNNLKKRTALAYEKYKDKFHNPDEFKGALEEALFDDYLNKIKTKIYGRQDAKLIKEIIQKLERESWYDWMTQGFPMVERIHCAKQLMDYLDNEDNPPDTAISDEVLENYPTLCKRFGTEIQVFNDNIRRAKIKTIITSDAPGINKELAQKAVKPKRMFDYFRATVGGIAKLSESKQKSAGDKAREQARREDVTFYTTRNARADNLRGAVELCEQKAEDFGFISSTTQHIGFEIFHGTNLTEHIKVGNKKNRFILHIDKDWQKKLFYINYSASPIDKQINLAPELSDNLFYDLIYIATQKAKKGYKPLLSVRDLSEKYSSEIQEQNFSKNISTECPDLINFIVNATGFIPPDLLQDEYTEMAQIQKLAAEITQYGIEQNEKNKYTEAIEIIKKISTLEYSYFRTSESVIPRYKCKDILTKLSKLLREQQTEEGRALLSREYFRSSYKLYQTTRIPSDKEITDSKYPNPKFYYCPKTKDIAYVDAFGVIHRSKLKPRVNTGTDFDYYANAALDTSPEKLSNILAQKTKGEDGAYTLDSEEVFKYISLKVEDKDKDGFKMCTVNEELEIIIADEVATTREAFKKLCMTALYAALVIMLVFVPGFNVALFAAVSVGIGYFPNFYDSAATGAYNDALRNAGMAVLLVVIMAAIFFIPGLNFLSIGAAAGAMVYVTLAIASLTTAFYLGATINAASKNPKAKEANRELVKLKEKIKEFTSVDDKPEDENATLAP